MRPCVLLLISFFYFSSVLGQENPEPGYELTLDEVIALACDSSLDVFIARNNYLAEYWMYKNYKAGKLPFIDFNSTPVDFNRSLTQEYSFADSAYNYVEQQTLSSYLNLSLNQNITKTGGRIFVDSDLGRLENLKGNNPVQYSTTIIRVGLEQQLIGFNPYKWDNRMSPLRFEAAKKEYLESVSGIAVKAVEHFFDLALAQVTVEIAVRNLANADTLYAIGEKRFAIASVSQEDLYTLQLDLINSRNRLKTARKDLNRAKMRLNSFLRMDESVDITLKLPENLPGVSPDPLKALSMARENNPVFINNRLQLLDASRDVEQARKESKFSSSLLASLGLNQSARNIPEAYQNPEDQEKVRVTLSVPVVDWGVARGRYKLAMRHREAARLMLEQNEIDFEQDVINTVNEFIIQKDLVSGAAQADTVAGKAYEITKRRFLTGKADLTKLNIASQSRVNARTSYITALERYWNYYYTIRQLTLYDFEGQTSLSADFDRLMGLAE